MAKRVIQQSRHVLSVDKKTYEVEVTEHQKSLDPDKVESFVWLSGTVRVLHDLQCENSSKANNNNNKNKIVYNIFCPWGYT